MAKLTKTLVEGLRPGEPDYFVWDDLLPGFGVRVWPTGRKTYVAQYRASGRTRRVKIGQHGPLTVEEARKEAKGILGDVARGEDPQEDRMTRRKSLTLRELCDDYLAAAERGLILGRGGTPKKGSTLYIDRGRIDRHIKPILGAKLVCDITPADVARFIQDVTVGKTATVEKTDKKRGKAIVEGGSGTAARAAGLLGGILSYAVTQGVIPINPASGVKKPAGKKRDRRLFPHEYRALGLALAAAADEGEPEYATAPFWILALTGCRKEEVFALRWSDVDLAGSALRLGDSKTGKSVRPLPHAAARILAAIQRHDSPFVFPAPRAGQTGGRPQAFKGARGAWERIHKRAGLPADITMHTLRHGFGSVGGDLGLAESTIKALIGHAGTSVTSRYIHRLDAVLVETATRVADEVYRQMTTDPEGEAPGADAPPISSSV